MSSIYWKSAEFEALIEKRLCRVATDEEIRKLIEFLKSHPEAARSDLDAVEGIRPEALLEMLQAVAAQSEATTVWELSDQTDEVLDEIAHQAPEEEPELAAPEPESAPASAPTETVLEVLPRERSGLWLGASIALAVAVTAGVVFTRHFKNPVEPVSIQAVHVPLSRAEMRERFLNAIQATWNEEVVYDDVLGEGSGAWDSRPRYPDSIPAKVNCIIWIDQVISEVYASRPEERVSILDRLRYYGGNVAYGLRKHYITHWVALEPEPLIAVPASQYTHAVARERVTLDFKRFLSFHQFPCDLYRMDRNRFEFEYAKPSGLIEMARKLPEGFYILFGVATPTYLREYGKSSGPLGLVHGLLLEVEGEPGKRTLDELFVYHASTAAKRVRKEKLATYVKRMTRSLHKGYVVYDLDPAWDFTRPLGQDPQMAAIEKCERSIASHRASSKLK